MIRLFALLLFSTASAAPRWVTEADRDAPCETLVAPENLAERALKHLLLANEASWYRKRDISPRIFAGAVLEARQAARRLIPLEAMRRPLGSQISFDKLYIHRVLFGQTYYPAEAGEPARLVLTFRYHVHRDHHYQIQIDLDPENDQVSLSGHWPLD